MLAALIVAAAYLRPLVGGDTFALRDQLTWTLPSRAYLHAALASGRVPEWNDGVGLGIAFAANPAHGVAYLPAWLVALVPSAWGSDFLLIAHLALLAAGTSVLARRIGADRAGGALAGVAAGLSGYAASVIVDGIPILSLAWTPWLLLAIDRMLLAERGGRRRAAAWAAAAWAAQILSGEPACLVDAGLVALAWTLVRAPRRGVGLAWLGGSLVAALPLAMVSLLPSLHLLGASERAGGLPFADATVWSMHPRRLLELAWPRLPLPDEANGRHLEPTWAFSVYLGAPVLAFAALAVARGERHARALAVVALALVVLALGRYTPLYALYRAIALPERLIRYPEKHVSGVVTLVALLAGVGFTRAFEGKRGRIAPAIVLAVAAVPFAVFQAWGAALACAAVAGALVLRRPSLALGAIALHLAVEGWVVQPLVPRAAVTRVPPLLAPIATTAPGPRQRVYRLPGLQPRSQAATPAEASIAQRDTGLENAGVPFGVAHVPGYEPALEARWHAAWDAGAQKGAQLLDRFDVRWVILPAAAVAHTPFVARAELGGLVLAENPQHRPRAFVARSLALDGTLTPCAIATARPEDVDLSCDAPAAGYAVLLDAYADGWRATVDGAPAPIVRADEVARAVAIPAGAHTIAFRYRTPGLRAGALVSMLAWILFVILAAPAPRASAARP